MNTTLTLNDGQSIPRVGLGVWQARGEDVVRAVEHALRNGYRHIDTAAIYENEEGVGAGIRASGIARQDLYLTTKVWNERMRTATTLQAVDESLQRLGVDYVDLMLLHWPADGRVQAWRDLIEAQKAGKVRSIGVSNFLAEQLDELVDQTGVVPVLNQIEHHPRLTQPKIRAACERLDIAVEAWSPLMMGRFQTVPVLAEIGDSMGRSAAQVMLRWALQRNCIVIPKSVTPHRIDENGQLFDFELDAEAMARINAATTEERLGPDPATFTF